MAAKEWDLIGWDYQEYTHLFPLELSDTLIQEFVKQKWGWKRKARLLLDIQKKYTEAHTLERTLVALCGRVQKQMTPAEKLRRGLRHYYIALTHEQLEKACNRFNVSYTSFMSANDVDGMIESLIDETSVLTE